MKVLKTLWRTRLWGMYHCLNTSFSVLWSVQLTHYLFTTRDIVHCIICHHRKLHVSSHALPSHTLHITHCHHTLPSHTLIHTTHTHHTHIHVYTSTPTLHTSTPHAQPSLAHPHPHTSTSTHMYAHIHTHMVILTHCSVLYRCSTHTLQTYSPHNTHPHTSTHIHTIHACTSTPSKPTQHIHTHPYNAQHPHNITYTCICAYMPTHFHTSMDTLIHCIHTVKCTHISHKFIKHAHIHIDRDTYFHETGSPKPLARITWFSISR